MPSNFDFLRFSWYNRYCLKKHNNNNLYFWENSNEYSEFSLKTYFLVCFVLLWLKPFFNQRRLIMFRYCSPKKTCNPKTSHKTTNSYNIQKFLSHDTCTHYHCPLPEYKRYKYNSEIHTMSHVRIIIFTAWGGHHIVCVKEIK